MTNKRELTDQELEKASGGRFDSDRFRELKAKHANSRIYDIYETEQHINEMIFMYSVPTHDYYVGKLLRSYEKTTSCGTERTLTLEVMESNVDGAEGTIVDVGTNDYFIYTSTLYSDPHQSLVPR